MSADLLATIVSGTRRIVDVRQQREPLAALARRAERVQPHGASFLSALTRSDRVNIIAECKRRSPSRGVLRPSYDPVAIARSYEQAGAASISVLTEPTFFDGSLDDLAAVRAVVNLPVLRKDFVLCEYQLFETKAAGAAAVLLIVAALDPPALAALLRRAADLGLDALVEVHDAGEVAVAIDAGANIIGVNNRNLRTLEVDVTASEALIARIPKSIVAVSESGLKSAADLLRLRDLGYGAFLMGERLMVEQDPGTGLQAILRRCLTTEDTKNTKETKDTKNAGVRT